MTLFPFSTKITHRIIAVSFPFVLLFIVEILIRYFFPFVPPTPQEIKGWSSGVRPAAGYLEPPLLIERNNQITPNQNISSFVHPFSFAKTKKKKRIFCFGGSATLGVPFEKDQTQTFPGKLQQKLEDAGEETEVINLGGASFGSDHVLALGIESLEYDPDFLVVYSGNNEFFNHMINLEHANRDWVFQNKPFSHLVAHIQSKFFPQQAKALQEGQEKRWKSLLQSYVVKPSDIDTNTHTRKDSIQSAVIKRYMGNLRKFYNRAHNRNIPIIFVVVPSNLYTPPAISIHTPGLTVPKEWVQNLLSIDVHSSVCSKDLEHLAKQNPWNASVWYKLGLCEQQNNQPHTESLIAALNLDMLPGRPNHQMNAALLKSELPLMLLEAKKEYFHDSCHLSEIGSTALSTALSSEILSQWNFSQKKVQQRP